MSSDTPLVSSVSISELSAAVEVAIRTHTPLFALGGVGIGKTEIMKQTAAALGFQYTEVVLRDVGDAYMPYVVPKENGTPAHLTFHYNPALPTIGNSLFSPDRPVLLNFDEATTYNRLCQNFLLKAFDEWKLGFTKLREDVVLVATGNRSWDHAHTEQFSSALANRGTMLHFEVDTDFWINHAISHDFHPLGIAWVKFDPTNLYNFDSKAFLAGDFAHPSPRSNEKLSRLLHQWEQHTMSDRLFRAEVCGTIGMARGTKFAGFAKIQSKLPNFDHILAGKKAPVPDDPSVIYACLYALIQRADRNSLGNVCNWIDQLPPEYHLLFTKLVAETKAPLVATSAWGKWLTEHTNTLS